MDNIEKELRDIKILLYGILMKSVGDKAGEQICNRITKGFKYKMNLEMSNAEKELKALKEKNKQPQKSNTTDSSEIVVETRNELPNE